MPRESNRPEHTPTAIVLVEMTGELVTGANTGAPGKELKFVGGAWALSDIERIVEGLSPNQTLKIGDRLYVYYNPQAGAWHPLSGGTGGGILWGVLQDDLPNDAIVDVQRRIMEGGTWTDVLDTEETSVMFKTTARNVPDGKQIPNGSFVGCGFAGKGASDEDVYCVVVSDCPEDTPTVSGAMAADALVEESEVENTPETPSSPVNVGDYPELPVS